MREFRLLKANEIECRISEVDRSGRYVRLLLYKTARTDALLLDEKVGWKNWQNDYKLIDGKMYCGIALYDEDKDQWVWKWNVGTESNTEAEKGQASDAMKRAGFCWGIGTELYSAPDITIWPDKCEIKADNGGKQRCYDRFDVTKIGYDENENISYLEIYNTRKRCVAFTFGMPPRGGSPRTPAPTAGTGNPSAAERPQAKKEPKDEDSDVPFSYTDDDAPPMRVACKDCGKIIEGRGKISAEDMIYRTSKKYGVPLCFDCGMKRGSAEN